MTKTGNWLKRVQNTNIGMIKKRARCRAENFTYIILHGNYIRNEYKKTVIKQLSQRSTIKIFTVRIYKQDSKNIKTRKFYSLFLDN